MNKKIVLIEDEEILSSLLAKKLKEKGYQVELAENGEVGLKKVKRIKPDLILLDIVMPKMGGFEVMEHIIKDEDVSDIPIVIISNSGQPVELDKAKEMGAVDWLVKVDFDPSEVIEKVTNYI